MSVVTQFPAARESELRFQAMFEGAAIGIGICQLDGRMLEANAALGRMLGYSPQELTGTHAGDFFSGVRPDIYAEVHREIGREIPPDNFSQEERLLGELLGGARGSFEIEKRYLRKDGSELWGHLTVSLAVSPGRDGRREPAFLVAMLVDATERKRVEEHLREAEKMEVIGRLAGGIAHDFNNPLTGILLYCDLLSVGLERGGWERIELCQQVEEVRMAGEQGAALTQQLLAIARKQAAEPRPIPINEIVTSTKNLLQRLVGEQIELVTELDSGAGQVFADPAQLRQILMNLVLNARDAMAQSGKIRLSTRAAELSREFSGEAEAGSARRAVSLVVKDNGCGMNAETRARLFEPFFTTKKPGEGTGLGLATVQRIVREAGGMIEVESEPGGGTCIRVLLPAIERPSARELSLEPSSIMPALPEVFTKQASPLGSIRCAGKATGESGGKTILLVDDHAPARKSMQRVLLNAGYRILAASSGKQALKVFAEHAGAVDLLIADFTMPGMNGQEVAETLLGQKPDLKVLMISGYPHTRDGRGAVALIRKPFSGRALIKRVVEVIRSP
jgi:signal transduction histidine kinase